MSERKLNKAQKEAVDYVKGPLLIVAGAGTGKTTVITSKIAQIVEKKLAEPHEILALTFTEKAAAEMQERVDQLVELGYADMQISTFHAFCQRILERHAIDIGLSNQFKMLTQTAAWLLVRKNFNKFNLDYYRPIGSPLKHIHELLKHFSKCKDELITPQEYLEYAEGESKTGSMNLDERSRLTEVATAYHTYNQLLIDNALFDFGDLIFYTHQLFKTRPTILGEFQKRYKYILVDEFQDVNWAQYELVKLLSDGGSQLTVVGDDDQSIYAFRGASVSNILRFKDDFPKAKEIVLNENYRSNQIILDKAYESIQNNNPDRLEVKLKVDKKLVSKKSVILSEAKNPSKSKTRDSSVTALPQNDSVVAHIHSRTLADEAAAVVSEIKRLKEVDDKATWDDFAILVRANSHADPFMAELERERLPYEFLSSAGLYRQPIVVDCINYLKLMIDHRDSNAVFRLLSLPFLKLKVNDLHSLTFTAGKKAVPLYGAIRKPEEYGVAGEGSDVCRKVSAVIDTGLKEMKHKKPYQLLVQFLEDIGYFKYLIDGEKEGNERVIKTLYHLNQFLEYIKEYEAISPDANVANFLEHFTMVTESGDKGALYQISDTPDSINILTIHASKGLEFKYVFMVNCVEDRFPSRAKGDGIEIPIELIREQLPEGDSHVQEERRLFYVGVTRAKERLYFMSAADYGGTRTKKISRFLAEVGYVANEPKNEAKKILYITDEQQAGKSEYVYELPKAFSFSKIKTYQECPYRFKLAHILNLPTKSKGNFSFGTTIHATLQAFYLRIQELNSVQQVSLFSPPPKASATTTLTKVKVPTVEELLAMYDQKWIDEWYASERQKEDYYKKGKDVLKMFYAAQEDNWTIPTYLESWFKIKIGDYFINGRIDRVDQSPDGKLEIIDYKTGKSKESLSSEDKEQLLIYQIAAETLPEYSHVGQTGKLTFYYVEDGIKSSFVGSDKELEKLKEKIIGAIDRIYAKDFTATPSQFACDHCDFKDICDFRV